ncbi:MAG: hypothetical protein IJ394_02260 [Bacteroidales bacterium]|nr:hypothetical protein [Bacteroidales bacterium]
MKKIYAFITAVIVLAAVSVALIVNIDKSDSFFEANVEALADVEQPDINECIYDPRWDCEALHPTDPSKDKYRQNARW